MIAIWHSTLLAGSLLFDKLIGDPRSNWHPVALIGRYISWIQGVLLKEQDSPLRKKLNGLLLWLTITISIYVVVEYLVLRAYSYLGGWALIVEMLLVSFTITPTSLARDGNELYDLLKANKLTKARERLSWIVGRDTDNLDEAEITRATVETIAENITDGIIAPLFFAMLGGAPLAFFYRAVNTLDSMVGYKNDKYMDFGMPSARLDDVCNYIPARITGWLVVLSAYLLNYDYKRSYAVMLRDSKVHPSPNSGWPEASVAGALGIRLGGTNYYFGRKSFRAYMGDKTKELQAEEIKKVIKIMYTVSWMAALIFTVIMLGLSVYGL